tara:strand:+ start:63 stop:437 length:375 start_codon:yes stop_codon:yes gene_type:complete
MRVISINYGNPKLVGSTIHYLSKGLDNSPILYHALSKFKKNPFEYTMSASKLAFHSLVKKIKNKSLTKIKTIKQNTSLEIRCSKKIDFNDGVIKKFYKQKIKINKKFDLSMLKDPFILSKNNKA